MQKPSPRSLSIASWLERIRARMDRRGSAWRVCTPLAGVLLGASLLYGVGLGALDLWAPDEPRYGAIAEELRSFRHGSSGLVLLRLNDAPYTQKPPLYFWLAAAAGADGGRVDELAARLPSAVAGVLCIGLTAWIGHLLFRNPRVAWLAAGLLATSFRFAFSARRAQLDVLLTACELMAIALFLWLEMRRGGAEAAPRQPWIVAGMHGALGAAALVKGPVGWLPLLVIAGYLGWGGRLRALRGLVPFWSLGLSLAPVVLWISAASLLAPAGFADSAVHENLIGRFFSGTSHARPFYYYLYQLPLDALPWSLLLPLALPVLWQRAYDGTRVTDGERWANAPFRFVISWLLLPFLFFTLSAGKRGLYLLPLHPALALCAAFAVDAGLARARWPRLDAWRLAKAILIVGGIELFVFSAALPWLNDAKSPRPIAAATSRAARPNEPVGVYGLGPIEGGLTYYGDVSVASLRTEDELRKYLESGGRLLLLRTRHFEAWEGELGLQELERFRGGRRALSLVEARRAYPSGQGP